MQKTKTVFNIFLYVSIFLLLALALYYNPFYWEHVAASFMPSASSLPLYHKILVYIGEAFLIILALCLFIFRNIIYKHRVEISILVCTIVIMFFILEVGARMYVCGSPDDQKHILLYGECGLEATVEPHHYLNYHGNPNYVSPNGENVHNSYGFRGPEITVPKPDGVYRIVALGGSTTYTIGVDSWEDDYPRQLEYYLRERFGTENIEVINAGLSGWNSWESLINLEFRVLDLDPDMIVIYHGTNDVHTRLVSPESYRSDNSGSRKQWEEREAPIFFKSFLVRLVTGISPGGTGNYVETDNFAGRVVSGEFNEKLGATPRDTFEVNKPVYFERNLRSMIGIANEYDTKVMIASWAYTTQAENNYASTEHYAYAFNETNVLLRSIGERDDVHFYDFSKEMPADEIYWSDNVHVNLEGSRVKGKLFSDFIFQDEVLSQDILSKI